MMDERYIRNLPALSREEFAMLQTKQVLVVGCGGLGGYIIEMLSRIGIGRIRVVDGDCFEETNLNRQLLSRPGLIGASKAETAKARILAVNPELEAEAVCTFLNADNADELVSGCDLVMDALDNIESRRILKAACDKAGIPYVFGAISAWLAQCALSMPGDNILDILYPHEVKLRDNSSLAFTPALCASMQCSLCTRLLCGRDVKGSTLYCFDLLNMEFEAIDLG